MEEHSKDLSDYIDALKRRRLAITAIATTIFIIGLVIALIWPPTYRSAATILIEEQQIPAELVQSTVTSYASQRIQTISQRVMTRSNLSGIIDKYALYTDERKHETMEEILTRMREDIKLEMISAEVVDPRTGRPTAATIAFSLAFLSESPASAQKVANELTTLYLQENIKTRASKAEETTEFLADEATRFSARIADLEQQLARFKAEHADSLPELETLLRTQVDRTERELSDLATQLSSLDDRRFYLEGQLGQLDAYGSDVNMSPGARLKALRTEYATISARYSPDHPDVMRLKREIEGLEREVGGVDSREALLVQLDTLRTERASAREKYSEEHPDVVRLDRAIAGVEEALAKSGDGSAPERAPDNPAYVTLQAQLNAVANQVQALQSKRTTLEQKRAEYEERLAAIPQVTAEYRTLTRDLDNATRKYQEITAKQMQAQMAQQLETESKGERFTLIEPPVLPEEPIKPNRPAIIFLSLVLALGGGIGFAAVAESMDSSVRGVKGIMNAVQVAPLAVIPYLENDREVSKGRRRTYLILATIIVAIGAALLLIHFFWTPLDVLWFKALRRASRSTGIDL